MNNYKIKSISIEGIGGIKHLNLSFQDGMNIICGTNGIGKTTILECIAHAFISNNTDILKKNVNANKGICNLTINTNNTNQTISYELNHFKPIGNKDFLNALSTQSKNILFFNEKRFISYIPLESITKDPSKGYQQTSSDAYNGISASNIKNWFIQRYMWSAHENILKNEQLFNLDSGKRIFNILDSNVKFSRIIPDTYDIMVLTRQGEVYFEYLSSGYKSCVYILLGIIKEIEFRFKDPYVKITDFAGVILIDEIDVHLHPQWQESLIEALRKLFPKAQIIATTHSPTIIQCANANEIIPLHFDEKNNIVIRELDVNEYGFQGWSIEEILTDVMGMKAVRSELFTTTIKEFDKAIDNGNAIKAKENYKKLDKMLHPKNYLRKLLEISMIGVDKD